MADVINDSRKESWTKYYTGLEQLQQEELIKLPFIPVECEHNAHMFYIKCKSLEERTRLIQFLKSKEIQSVFHYIPLHSSAGGLQFGRFHGVDKFTTSESDKILRLPMYYNIDDNNIGKVIEAIYNFYH